MAKKTKALEEGVKISQDAAKAKIQQDIANLCTSIGDRYFVIREAQGEITKFHTEIDSLREKLRILEAQNGPQATK